VAASRTRKQLLVKHSAQPHGDRLHQLRGDPIETVSFLRAARNLHPDSELRKRFPIDGGAGYRVRKCLNLAFRIIARDGQKLERGGIDHFQRPRLLHQRDAVSSPGDGNA
jgi:hypothetical protein